MLLEKLNELDRILNSMVQVHTPHIIPLVREMIEMAKKLELAQLPDTPISVTPTHIAPEMATVVEPEFVIENISIVSTLTPLEHVNDALLDKAREFLKKKKVSGVHFYKPENLLAKAREKWFNF